MGYIIDMYQGKYKADRNLFKFALFVSYFPHILQGPIGRYNRLAHQFFEKHEFDLVRIQHGLQLMAWGFFKKMVLADRAALIVEEVFRYVHLYHGFTVFMFLQLLMGHRFWHIHCNCMPISRAEWIL